MSTGFDFSLSCVYWLYNAGQPSSRPCLRQGAGLISHFAVIEEIKANNTVPVVKPLHDGPYFVPLASILISLVYFFLPSLVGSTSELWTGFDFLVLSSAYGYIMQNNL